MSGVLSSWSYHFYNNSAHDYSSPPTVFIVVSIVLDSAIHIRAPGILLPNSVLEEKHGTNSLHFDFFEFQKHKYCVFKLKLNRKTHERSRVLHLAYSLGAILIVSALAFLVLMCNDVIQYKHCTM